jgi:hypothetical protein
MPGMTRILVSEAAYQAIRASLPEGARELEPLREGSLYALWLPRLTLNQLAACRAPGEGFSETILRLARIEAMA